MKRQKNHTNKIVLIAILLLMSCSTKKKSWVNRQYHNTTAKYNGYFNGNESLKRGVKKTHTNHKDDYTAILPFYKEVNLKKSNTHSYMDKAIKKGSVVIQRHSMKIRGKEYCRWIDDNYLLVGKAYFYKGDFEEAIKTFNFIIEEYKKNEIRFEATLWLIRSYVENKNFSQAEMILEELENDKKKPKNFEKHFGLVKADFYLQQNNLSLALEELKTLEKLIKRKRKKVRINYIIAQIYQQHDNYKQARYYYEKVLKSNPEYEMAFNAKMNLARSLESGSKDTKKIHQKLLKMIKDEKNKEYLDQIYYTLADVELNNNDTLSAKANYLLSTQNSINNDAQKALSFLSLGEIEYNTNNYLLAKDFYDSTIYYMEEGFRQYEEVKARHEVLVDLTTHLNIISLEDSLQVLARLPENKKRQIVNEIIQKEIQKEKEILEEKRQRQSLSYEGNARGGRNNFGNNTSGGKWYFYNPATLSFGMSEFRKKWGKRNLEDNWRRKDKKSLDINLEIDSSSVDSINKETKNKKDPSYYLAKLPSTSDDFEKSDNKIKESLYQAAIIYREDLFKHNKSTEMFSEIINKYPKDDSYSSLAYYNIYRNYIILNQLKKAEETKQKLLKTYPNSVCAKILTDPDFQKNIEKENDIPEIKYQTTYANYNKGNYQDIIATTQNIKEDDYKPKYIFLRALSFASMKDTINAKKELNKLIVDYSELDISKQARDILEAIDNPERITKANQLSLSEYPYLLMPEQTHMCVLVIPKKDLDVNYFKTLISDYNSEFFENEIFEIGAMLIGFDKHLITIKRFKNASKAIEYCQQIENKESIAKVLAKRSYKIMAITMDNFQEFYKNKDIDGYFDFYKKNYLKN